jgi:hypothetical protein
MNSDIPIQTQTLQINDRHGRIAPEFFRLPKPPLHCPFSGLSRSALNALILGPNPAVRSVVIKKRGAVRGIRLIDYDSLMGYLHQLGQHDDVSEPTTKEVQP